MLAEVGFSHLISSHLTCRSGRCWSLPLVPASSPAYLLARPAAAEIGGGCAAGRERLDQAQPNLRDAMRCGRRAAAEAAGGAQALEVKGKFPPHFFQFPQAALVLQEQEPVNQPAARLALGKRALGWNKQYSRSLGLPG